MELVSDDVVVRNYDANEFYYLVEEANDEADDLYQVNNRVYRCDVLFSQEYVVVSTVVIDLRVSVGPSANNAHLVYH